MPAPVPALPVPLRRVRAPASAVFASRPDADRRRPARSPASLRLVLVLILALVLVPILVLLLALTPFARSSISAGRSGGPSRTPIRPRVARVAAAPSRRRLRGFRPDVLAIATRRASRSRTPRPASIDVASRA